MEFNTGHYNLIKTGLNLFTYQFEQARLNTRKYEVVNTSYGKVRGVKRKNAHVKDNHYYAFEGIPFAKPPLRELRFRAPEPPEPWYDVLNCTHCRPKPMQYNLLVRVAEGSEDCLYLNVYAKKLEKGTRLPVMVWIYGGGFQYGEATRDLYAPDYLMMQDVVVVTFNYRLGVFGFLCLDDPDLNIPGNAGLKDQVLALKWIKENIHHFSGDPNNITLFGESAGAVSTHMLMISPQAKGLFHKAIMQSGSAYSPWGYTELHDWGYKLACHLGYAGDNNDKDVYKYLYRQSSRRLLVNCGSFLTKDNLMVDNLFSAFVPVTEPYLTSGCIASRPYKELLPCAWGNEIPLIIGGTAAEGLFYHCMTLKTPYVVNELKDVGLVHLLPDDIKRVHSINELQQMSRKLKMAYFNDEVPTRQKHLFQYLELMGHRSFWHPVYRAIIARSAYAPNVPTYCYTFDFDSQTCNHGRTMLCSDSAVSGASHVDDVCYLFRNLMSENLSPHRREFKCIERMVGMWYNFALVSNPNCKEIKPAIWQWVEQGHQPIKCLVISDDIVFKQLPIYDKMRVWTDFYTKESLV